MPVGDLVERLQECDAAPDYSALNAPEAQAVVKLIDAFPDTIRLAIQRSEPSLITRFSVELAKAFNKFYYESRILDDDMAARRAKINLTIAAKTTIKTALGLIGIGAPERM